MATIKFKRGAQANIDKLTLAEGEPAVALDTGKLYIGVKDGEKKCINSDVDSSLTKTGYAADAKVVGDMLRDIMYEPISITSFSNNVGTVEMGKTVTSVTLNWAYSKTPATAKLDGAAIGVSETSKTLSGLSLTTNKTYTLAVTDEREATASRTTSITFLNGVYWGVGAAAPTLDSAFILGLTKSLQGSRAKTFTVNAAAAQHIYFACPSRYGTCGFNVGGFDGGFSKAGTVSFTNASGYTENYDVYKSDNAGLGNTTVKVS